MASVGGDIIEVTWNHPTLGSGVLYPKAAEDSTIDLGGLRGADDANMVAGNGENIKQLTRTRWSVEVTVANDMNTREDAEKMGALAGSPVDAEWTFSSINGTVWGGTGSPVGDIQPNANAATFTLKVAGGGVLKKIVG
jgi:hypothetical protein